MITCKRICAACAFLLWCPYFVLSQGVAEVPRTLEARQDTFRLPNYASLAFDKNLNTYRWNGLAKYTREMGSLSLQFSEQFLSSLIRTDQNLIRDEQSLDLFMRERLTDKLKGIAKVSSLSVTDNKSIALGNTSSNALYGGIAYRPIDHIIVEPLLGMRFDNQFNQRDKGLSYLLNLSSDSLDYEGYRTQLNGMMQYDRLTPRTLQRRSALISIERNFFERTRNALQLQYYGNRRDFYFPADANVQQQFQVGNNIETRTEDALSVADSLDYTLGKNVLLSFQGNVFTRSVGRETKYKTFVPGKPPPLNTTTDELKIDGGAKTNYFNGSDFSASVGFYYQERDEKHRVEPENAFTESEVDKQTRFEELKNNHSRRTSLTSTMDAAISQSQTVSLSGSVSLLRYDTPSAGNDDDRDELWYIFNLTTSHRVNQYINMRFAADVNLTHLVYLASTRSANNTWNRIFRLSPRLEYVPSKEFTTINTFEVLANYTVYDVEYSSATVRSIVFRQFSFVDSSRLELTQRLSFEWSSNLRLYERGELRWDTFTEQPLNYFEEKTYVGKIQYILHRHLIFSVGIRYFSQSRFVYAGRSRNIQGFLRSIGPITNIFWNVGKQTEFSISGWYESQSQTGVTDRGIANMTMSLTVRI